MSIAATLSRPFFRGVSSVSALVPSLLPVAIAGHPYMADPTRYQSRMLPALRQPIDTSQEPGEASLNTEGLWPRSQSDWRQGAGQAYLDDPDSDRRRFWRSDGVDVWTESELKLLPETVELVGSAETNLEVLAVGTRLYLARGTTLEHTDDPQAAAITWTDAAIQAGETAVDIESIATDGSFVYAALGANGIHRTAVGASSSTAFSAFTADLVAFVNGRLLAADGPELVEVAADGTTTAIVTHRSDDFVWHTIAGAPNGIYAAGSAGGYGEVVVIGIDETDGSLATPAQAAPLPDGETVHALASYGGAMLMGTSAGLRTAQIADSGGLLYGQAIALPEPCLALEPQGQFCWFGWSSFGASDEVHVTDAHKSGLGRADLSRETEPLVPAYASDLMVGSEASPVTGDVTSVVTFDGRRYFTIAGEGLYGQGDDLVAEGSLYPGWVRYGVLVRKVLVSIDVRHDPLDGEVSVHVHDDEGDSHVLGSSSRQGSVGPSDPLAAELVVGEAFLPHLTLTRDSVDATAGPALRRWTSQAVITPPRQSEIVLGLVFRSSLAPLGSEGPTVPFDPLIELMFLEALADEGRIVTYQEGVRSRTVRVDSVGVPDDGRREWSSGNRYLEGAVDVRLVTF